MSFETSSITEEGKAVLTSSLIQPNITSRFIYDEPQENKFDDFVLTEIGISELFADMHKGKLKYNFDNNCWYIYDGTKWNICKKNEISEVVKEWLQVIKSLPMFLSSESQKWLKANATRSKISNILKLSNSNKNLATASNEFDLIPELINFTNGTYNLETSVLQPHNPDDMLTKIINFDYDADAKCPHWLTFINRVVDNDQNIIEYLQKACGYSISGTVSEEKVFYVYGAGGNGKSVFFNILMEIFKDFVIKTPTEMLLQKSFDGIPNDVVRMKGARMVVAAEMPENRNLNESKLKDLSGGDALTGRYLFQEYVEFKPMHSLWLYGNSKPKIVGTDNGIWRRIVILPFRVTIPDNERIPRHILQANLLSNKQGIFNWLIEGLSKYNSQGLKLPAILVEEMNEYRASLDETVSFISDCCIIDKKAECMGSDLVNSYETWCQNHGITSSGKKKLYEKLSNKGFEKCMTRAGHYTYFKGLRIRQEATENEK